MATGSGEVPLDQFVSVKEPVADRAAGLPLVSTLAEALRAAKVWPRIRVEAFTVGDAAVHEGFERALSGGAGLTGNRSTFGMERDRVLPLGCRPYSSTLLRRALIAPRLLLLSRRLCCEPFVGRVGRRGLGS